MGTPAEFCQLPSSPASVPQVPIKRAARTYQPPQEVRENRKLPRWGLGPQPEEDLAGKAEGGSTGLRRTLLYNGYRSREKDNVAGHTDIYGNNIPCRAAAGAKALGQASAHCPRVNTEQDGCNGVSWDGWGLVRKYGQQFVTAGQE